MRKLVWSILLAVIVVDFVVRSSLLFIVMIKFLIR
jgi:hypothetical protein